MKPHFGKGGNRYRGDVPEDRRRLNGSVERIIRKGAHSKEELLTQVGDLVKNIVRKHT